MVFCGIYPADGAKYPDLKDALEKLQLNDASLTFELETSAALGFGFRCGFLGLLHMEIITERLEREFDLDIITTTPSVRYRLTLTDGTVEMIDNPSSYPDPSNIVKQEEPFVDVHLYTPNDYVGGLMDLCQSKRGVLIDMKYLDDVRVDLHYALPLGEIVYDFFDAIKSRSRGYASYDYEFKEYRESDLVKLDFLLNGDPVDALSMIVFRDNAYAKGRRICEKLRDNIPAHTCSRSRCRRPSAARSLPARQSRPCARTCWPSATAAISPVKRSCWKSRRKAKRRCVSWAAFPCPARPLPPCSSWTATTIDLQIYKRDAACAASLFWWKRPNVKSAHGRDALFAFHYKYVIISLYINSCIRF